MRWPFFGLGPKEPHNMQLEELKDRIQAAAVKRHGAGCTLQFRSVDDKSQWWIHDRTKSLVAAAPSLEALAEKLGLSELAAPPNQQETPVATTTNSTPTSNSPVPADAIHVVKAAELFGVSAPTVYHWAEKGNIRRWKMVTRTPAGEMKLALCVSPDDIRHFLTTVHRAPAARTRKFRHIVRELRGEIPADGTAPPSSPSKRPYRRTVPSSHLRSGLRNGTAVQLNVAINKSTKAELLKKVDELNQPPYYMTLSDLVQAAIVDYLNRLPKAGKKVAPEQRTLHPLVMEGVK